MIAPFLASAVLGLIKGLTSTEAYDFSWEQDLIGPAKEEALFRGPLYFFPNAPRGSTALVFAAAHLDDHVAAGDQMTPLQVLARLGDTFLGGWWYEQAMRGKGRLPAAIAAHAAHNLCVALGSRVRR